MKKIILDTNFLLIPGQFMVDIFTEINRVMNEPYVLVVLDKTLNELEKLGAGTGKSATAAKLGLALIMAKIKENPTVFQKMIGLVPEHIRKVVVVRAGKGYVDDAILHLVDQDTIVATQDKLLKKKLQGRGFKVMILAQKKHVKLA